MSRRAASALTSALSLAFALAASPAAWAKSTDRNQPMDAQANSTDCTLTDDAPCVMNGNVHITQGTLEINSANADVRRRNGEMSTVKLTGTPAQMKQQTDDGQWTHATAAQIDYDVANDTIVLTGNANVQQPGSGSITGARIVYNTATSQVRSGAAAAADGTPPSRVTMRFEPKNKTPAGTPASTAPASGAPQATAPTPAPKPTAAPKTGGN